MVALFLSASLKPCPSPEVEFCLRGNSRFRAGLGIGVTLRMPIALCTDCFEVFERLTTQR